MPGSGSGNAGCVWRRPVVRHGELVPWQRVGGLALLPSTRQGTGRSQGKGGSDPRRPQCQEDSPGQRRVFPSSECEEPGPHLVLSVGFPNPHLPRPALFKRCSQMDGKWTQKHVTCSRTLTRKGPPPASSAPSQARSASRGRP